MSGREERKAICLRKKDRSLTSKNQSSVTESKLTLFLSFLHGHYCINNCPMRCNTKQSWVKRDQLDVTCLIISLFNAQHVSDVNTSILSSLRLIVKIFHGLYCSGSMCCGLAVVVWYPYAAWSTASIKRDQLDVTCFIISLFNAQHVSDVNTSIQELVTYVLSYYMGCIALVRCVLVLRCGLAGVVWYPYAGWSTRFSLHTDTDNHSFSYHTFQAL